MLSVKFLFFILLLVPHDTDGWRRRRRRRCQPADCEVSSWNSWSLCSTDTCGQQGSQQRSRTVTSSPSCGGAACPTLDETRQCYGSKPVDCQVSSWNSWSSCSTDTCGQQGLQRRSRTVASSASCGGAACPTLDETRQCYGSKQVDCQVSSWSQWSACPITCGVSGIQSSTRHRIIAEKCGGACPYTLRKTRQCQKIRCLNGGTLQEQSCFCKEGYTGDCCERSK